MFWVLFESCSNLPLPWFQHPWSHLVSWYSVHLHQSNLIGSRRNSIIIMYILRINHSTLDIEQKPMWIVHPRRSLVHWCASSFAWLHFFIKSFLCLAYWTFLSLSFFALVSSSSTNLRFSLFLTSWCTSCSSSWSNIHSTSHSAYSWRRTQVQEEKLRVPNADELAMRLFRSTPILSKDGKRLTWI